MQQIGQYRAVSDISWRRDHRVDQFAAAVDPEVSLHPKVPLLALPGLMHLKIARLLGILCRRRRTDDRRIDDRAGGHLQTLGCKVPLYLVTQPPSQVMLLERVVEAAHGGFVRNRLAAEVDAKKRRIAC
jgi:hypothetical protein